MTVRVTLAWFDAPAEFVATIVSVVALNVEVAVPIMIQVPWW